MNPTLNLVVLRTPDPDASFRFYSLLGLNLIKHRHGNGPEHYASETGPCVFEIYRSETPEPKANLGRLGFRVEKLDELVETLARAGVTVAAQPKSSPWGYRAVVLSPDGIKVELTQA